MYRSREQTRDQYTGQECCVSLLEDGNMTTPNTKEQKVYTVITSGVYRHEIVGVFTNIEQARERAQFCLAQERDTYHDMEIVSFPLDIAPDAKTEEITEETQIHPWSRHVELRMVSA